MIAIPEAFENILNKDESGYYKGAVHTTRSKFDQVFSENKLYFFEEYTDHGIRHINNVLKACADLITTDTYKLLNEKDISILILSVFLHDLGMHLQPLTFKKMIIGGYDDVLNEDFGDKPWAVLWQSYLFEAKKFNDQQREKIFGDANVFVADPNLDNPDSLTGIHRKLIGEFIRRHHSRIAYEVAFKGLVAHDGTQIDFCTDFDRKHRLLAGLLARSHGIHIRNTFPILEKHFFKVWRRPHGIHMIYLMTVLRLADYFQIDASRVLKIPFLTQRYQSSTSLKEHHKHLQTTDVQRSDEDPETLYITVDPTDSNYFLELESLFKDIQNEVDYSWAVLGEVYGLKPDYEQPKLTYRRIRSNMDDAELFERNVPYVPERISFSVDKEIPKLLVGPLYNYEPTYGVRELLQNAVDACWEREFYEQKKSNEYEGMISIEIESINGQLIFRISDNGKGMSLDEIKNYFLKVGGSFRKSEKWQHDHVDIDGHSNVNKSGRFGIGVLAAYLLGNEIEVKTRSIFSSIGYKFQTSLNQEQIEIIKDDSIDEGTIINIKIAKDVYGLLTKSTHSKFEHKPTAFHKWFVLKYPKVTYSLLDSVFCGYNICLPSFKEGLNVNWHILQNTEFNKISWAYINGFEHKLICNGFIISDYYRLKDPKIKPPALVIYDFDAKLAVNLNRTSVSFPLSFNDQLECEIYKDIISKLLVMPVDNPFEESQVIYKPTFFSHPALSHNKITNVVDAVNDLEAIVFCNQGYLLNHPVFIKKTDGFKHLKIFDTYYDAVKLQRLPFMYKFNLSDIEAISMATLTNVNKKKKLELKDLGRSFISQNYKNIIGWTEDFNVKSKRHDERQLRLNENIRELLLPNNKIKAYMPLIFFKVDNYEYKIESFGRVVHDILGDDLFIPYNLEDRKKKFPKAFKELEPYMRKYLNKTPENE